MLTLVTLIGLTGPISRDSFGVPSIRCSETDYSAVGYAVAEDRLSQMQTSAVLARGHAAAYLGDSFAAADRERIKTGYTDDELRAQFKKLDPGLQAIFQSYADGVNRYIDTQHPTSTLPEGLMTRHWEALDSVAICINMLQIFGRGGAGEIRNWALLQYLGGRANLKGKVFDVFDDFAWQNEPKATTTIADADWKGTKPTIFPPFDRKVSEESLARLPKVGIFELLPMLRAELGETSKFVAERLSAVFKTGSYCIVVGSKRSSTGHPLLLNGPQMGFRLPSIVHEMHITTPSYSVYGMDIPGVPGVVVGSTKDVAWGLTTGVADTEDYAFGTSSVKETSVPLAVAGKEPETIKVMRGYRGFPVVMSKGDVSIVRASSFWGRELETVQTIFALYRSKSVAGVRAAAAKATMNFNLFYATRDGHIGHEYTGLMPVRKPGNDPRLPVPFAQLWTSFVPRNQMPHVVDPKSGLIANWNNKPISWWPNGDTPVWGAIFRDQILRNELTASKLSPASLEHAIMMISRTSNDWYALAPEFAPVRQDPSAGWMSTFKGQNLEGSSQAGSYQRFLNSLRGVLFKDAIGDLISPSNFQQATQPSLILKALQGKTKFDYLAGKSKATVLKEALAQTATEGEFHVGKIPVPAGLDPVLYSDRGTFIQIVEMGKKIRQRTVLPPGVSESGPHAGDQAELARGWKYKTTVWP